MVRYLCVEQDPEGFRAAMVDAGFLRPDAPVSTETVVEHMAVFYDTVRRPGPLTMTGDYASSVVRRFFDVRSPLAHWVSVPRSYVILQRINLGLFAILGELTAGLEPRFLRVPRSGALSRFLPVKDVPELEKRRPEIELIARERGMIP